jgi:hypothetical protein
MKKLDAEATEASIRAEWAKVAMMPDMQHMYGQLQSNRYAIDMCVAGTLWGHSIPDGASGDDVYQAAASIVAGFLANLLIGQDEQHGHMALHFLIEQISIKAHESLGFTHDGARRAGTVAIDIPLVLKEVGDA